MPPGERWLANHAVTELWSGWDEHAVPWTVVPQWSVFQQLADQQGKRVHVHYFGNKGSQEGDVWVDAQDVGPIERPARTVEPEWPHPGPPATEIVHINPNYHPPTAPAIPAEHIPYLAAAARSAQVDVSILAATAARESGFADRAYREEAALAYVRWRKVHDEPLNRFPDGSLGPCQILRSNFLAYGIDNDEAGYSPEHNYRVAARIIRDNFAAFPTDRFKAVAAYNVGQYGAKLGRIPAGGYVDTILSWAKEYAQLFKHDPQAAEPTAAPASSAVDASGSVADQQTEIGQALILYGKTMLATPYVFGGKYIPRDNGIDCSGFVCEVFEHHGIDLGNRDYLSAEAIRQTTRPIGEPEAKTGDLIFFHDTYDTPGASHIGIWIGDGKMIDAHTHGGVQVTNVRLPYWKEHFLAIGRLPHFDNLPPAPAAPVRAPSSGSLPTGLSLPSDLSQCSFCGRRRGEVDNLFGAGNDSPSAICDRCIKIYGNILESTSDLIRP